MNPVEVAKEFEANGIRRLHVVGLDGAASHHVVNYRTLEANSCPYFSYYRFWWWGKE